MIFRFTISSGNKYLAVQNNQAVVSDQSYSWKIIPTMDENNYYIVGQNGTVGLDNGCHANENADIGLVVFWNVQYPCQKWSFQA